MRFTPPKSHKEKGFTLAEVAMAMAIVALFGLAAFATNSQLMKMLKSQRETTAATMMLQEQMEAFRSLTYAQVASFTLSANPSPSPASAADIVYNPTASEAQLGGINGSLSETIIVSGYMDNSGNIVAPTSALKNQWTRNASYPTGSPSPTPSSTLASGYDLLQVDLQLSWTGSDGRTRHREITSVIGRGNKGVSDN